MHIGIVGATGEVGRMMLRVLEEMKIRVDKLQLYSSAKSAGTSLIFNKREIKIKELTAGAVKQKFDYLLFSAGGRVSSEFALIAEEAGNTVIDNSSAFRKSRPLIVPEINGSLLQGYRGIIANPNCSTIQLVLALYPLHRRFGLEEIIVSTYQSVSGAGNKGIKALIVERNGMSQETPFPREIDLNVIPQIGSFDGNGECEEELKMISEIRMIMGETTLKIAVTTVRVPVVYGHAESVFARFREKIDCQEIPELYIPQPAVDYHGLNYITPKEIGESDKSHIGRMRSGYDEYSLQFWNVGHNIRIGAATNAVKILQYLTTQQETKR
jgi:aspartate-semialdehyde dehydrogenase